MPCIYNDELDMYFRTKETRTYESLSILPIVVAVSDLEHSPMDVVVFVVHRRTCLRP
jgi:hypothetical protein